MTTEEVYDEFNLGSKYFHHVTGDILEADGPMAIERVYELTSNRLWNIRETLTHMNPEYNCGHFYCCGNAYKWDTAYSSWSL